MVPAAVISGLSQGFWFSQDFGHNHSRAQALACASDGNSLAFSDWTAGWQQRLRFCCRFTGSSAGNGSLCGQWYSYWQCGRFCRQFSCRQSGRFFFRCVVGLGRSLSLTLKKLLHQVLQGDSVRVGGRRCLDGSLQRPRRGRVFLGKSAVSGWRNFLVIGLACFPLQAGVFLVFQYDIQDYHSDENANTEQIFNNLFMLFCICPLLVSAGAYMAKGGRRSISSVAAAGVQVCRPAGPAGQRQVGLFNLTFIRVLTDALPHFSVSLDVFQLVIIQYPEFALT